MSIRNYILRAGLPFLSLYGISACAIENDISFGVQGTASFTDNALKDREILVDERQDKFAASLVGNYTNDWAKADLNYTGSQFKYSEGSREDKDLVEGRSSVLFGSLANPFELRLSHDQRGVLTNASAIDEVSNLNNRSTVTVQPGYKFSISKADKLVTTVSYSKTNYEFDITNDVSTEGGGISWQHAFSPVDTLAVGLQQNSIKFSRSPDADYIYKSLILSYGAKLKSLQYEISGGVNRLERPEGEKSNPSYKFSAQYEAGEQKISISADRRLTDSSSSDPSFSMGDGHGAQGRQGLHMMDLRNYSLGFSSGALCARCEVSLQAYLRDENYIESNTSDKVSGYGGRFGFRFTRKLSAFLSHDKQSRSFSAEVATPDIDIIRDRVGLQYIVNEYFKLSLASALEERDSTNDADSYIEHINMLTVGFIF